MEICRHCGSPQIIEGDGHPVCAPCVAALGRIADDPATGSYTFVGRLAAQHADVVRLARGVRWEWVGWA